MPCWALELLGHQQRRCRHFRHLQHQPSSPANPLALQAPPPAVAPAPSPARQAAHQQAAAALGAALVSLAAACAPAPAAAADLKLGQEVFEATATITAGIAIGGHSRVGQLLQVGQGQPAANHNVVQQQLPHLAGTGGQ